MAAATTSSSVPETHELIIEAGRAERQYWRDLWLGVRYFRKMERTFADVI